jgi:divalent metal cation (Fe/Co/Zn/Cd) transporter
MPFRFYANILSQASRSVASGIMVVGLLLVGFGVIIVALPKLIGYLVAMVFFVAGLGCAATALKIFWAQRRIDRFNADDLDAYRRNVRIHTGGHFDQ